MKERLYSLDLLRGLDMMLLVVIGPLVKAANSAWHFSPGFMRQFAHGWECFTLWDIIMPLFIFMCGAAVPFALGRRLENGRAGAAFWRHVIVRVVMLWALGMMVQGNLLSLDIHKIKPYSNTLQSIAAGYFVTACVMLIKSKVVRIAVPIALAAAYSLMLVFGGDYSEFGNFAFKSDVAILRAVLPADHLQFAKPNHYTWFSTSLMFAAMALAGFHATEILRGAGEKWRKAAKLFVYGAGLEVVGWAVSPWIPVIKPIFTLSFTAQAMGWCVLALAALYVLSDILMLRKGLGVVILFGQSALMAYLLGGFFRPVLAKLAEILTQGFPYAFGMKETMPLAVAAVTSVEIAIFIVLRRRIGLRQSVGRESAMAEPSREGNGNVRNAHMRCVIAACLLSGAAACAARAQNCRTELIEEMPVIGKVAERGVGPHTSKMWMLGCECLDRDYAEFKKYRDYIPALGIARIRLQAGWARCEREKGRFDFAWLDEPIEWAAAHGISATLDLSYGNLIYKGGGQAGLAGAIPSGDEGLAAWDRWIETLVTRYRDKVDDYLMWNEPDTHRAKNDPRAVAEFNVRTARLIRRLSPESRVSALQLAQPTPENIRTYIKDMGDGWRLFDSVCWHRYGFNPDSRYAALENIAKVLADVAPGLKIRHTEAGCISEWADFFAMKHYPWTEIKQAKWDMRRMLGDISRGIETSVFTICDLRYTGTIDQMNRKGLLRANDKHDVIGVKKAYYAVRNVVSVFDASLVRSDSPAVSSPDRTVSLFGWKRGADPLFVFWEHGPVTFDMETKEFSLDHTAGPSNGFERRPLMIEWKGAPLRNPVWVDLFSGKVCAFPKERQLVHSCGVTFVDVPVYDSPCILAERDAVPLERSVVK